MNYIVLDLEWNQSNTGTETEAEQIPFEIIEIGAIKLDDDCVMIGEFSQLVKPVVYHELHHVIGRLVQVQMEELEHGKPFVEVVRSFLDWCGPEEYLFCTWGGADLTELQRNMKFYGLAPLSNVPVRYMDVQKLFSIAYEDRKVRRALEYAVDYLGLEKDIPFHRAFSDAYYTARVFAHMIQENRELLRNESYDVFHAPKCREDEVKVQFDTYAKYISREFADKAAALADREVSSSKCYLCHRNLRKKLKWFTANGRHYYCLAYCDKHGYLKGKIRMRKTDEGMFYAVKTMKLIDKEAADELMKRKAHAREQHKRNRTKYRMNQKRQIPD